MESTDELRPSDRKRELGPTGRRVAANVKALRGRIPVRELSARLTKVGHPIVPSGITKIEQGMRRVDADDLVALALVLGVTPNRLLLDADADAAPLELLPGLAYRAAQAWAWACGESMWGRGAGPHPASLFDQGAFYDWQLANRPHNVPVKLTAGEWRGLDPWQERLDELRAEAEEAGVDLGPLLPAQVTYEEHDDDDEHKGEHHG